CCSNARRWALVFGRSFFVLKLEISKFHFGFVCTKACGGRGRAIPSDLTRPPPFTLSFRIMARITKGLQVRFVERISTSIDRVDVIRHLSEPDPPLAFARAT